MLDGYRSFPSRVSYEDLVKRFGEVMEQRDAAVAVVTAALRHLRPADRPEDRDLILALERVEAGGSLLGVLQGSAE